LRTASLGHIGSRTHRNKAAFFSIRTYKDFGIYDIMFVAFEEVLTYKLVLRGRLVQRVGDGVSGKQVEGEIDFHPAVGP
jgi:hypothetical protein